MISSYDDFIVRLSDEMDPQKANPGGQLDPAFIVGRDRLIDEIWKTLEQQSVWMTAERRIGKTQIMNKMESAPKAGWAVRYFDLESVETALEFAQRVWRGVEAHLGRWKRVANRAKAVWDSIQGIGAGGVSVSRTVGPPSWKKLMEAAVEDLESEKVDLRLLFCFDELTYMVQRICKQEGEPVAMAVLDMLRHLRQTRRGFRMIVSGSVGLHQVLTQLREAGHQNEVMNDLYTVDVPPIDEADAISLALGLMDGEELKASNPDASARRIAEHACGWPFFIHHIAKRLATGDRGAEVARIDEVVGTLLVEPHDLLKMGHFRDRLETYYPGQADAAAAVLDALALATGPTSVDDLLREVRSAGQDMNKKALLELTRAMRLDHYLTSDVDGRLRLVLPLFARWWKLDRGI